MQSAARYSQFIRPNNQISSHAGSSDLAGTSSTLFYGRLFSIVLEVAQIWKELALHYFPADCFGSSSDLVRTGTTLFNSRLFWRQLRFGGNWLHNIFRQIILESAQIWWELAPHYFPGDCFGGGSDLVGTGSTLFYGGLSWRQLRFGGNWLILFSGRFF